MRWILYLFIFIFPVLSHGIEDAIYLSVGFQNDFPLDESFRDKKITFQGTYIKVTTLVYDKTSNSIRFSPTKIGVGTLHIKEGKKILKKYTVNVRKTELNRVAHEIQDLLREIDGIVIKIINHKVVVDGEIFVPKDMKRIFNVIKEYPKQAVSLVTLSASAQNSVARFMEKEIGNPNITVKAANGKFILRGTVATPEEKTNALIIAELYAPSVVTDAAVSKGVVRERNIKNVIVDLIKIAPKPKDPNKKKKKKLIQMVVHYVELDKDYDNFFHFQWSPQIGDRTNFTYSKQGGGAVGQTASIISGTISNFLPKLNWAKSFGFARILHNSNIIVEEGNEGAMSAKKEIPYTVVGENGVAKTEKVGVGIDVKIQPYIVGPRKDSVRLLISFGVNNFVGISGGVPVVDNRTLKTALYVRSGLSAAIGGLISNLSQSNYNREPSGQNSSQGYPLIHLLSSKNIDRNQNQFVVFVTPTIKSSASIGVEKIKQKFRVSQ